MLDPSERALFEKANAVQKAYEVQSEREMFLEISKKYAKELDAYNRTAQGAIKGNKVKSVISPTLIDHVVREGQRSLEMLNSLKNTEGAIYPPAVEG